LDWQVKSFTSDAVAPCDVVVNGDDEGVNVPVYNAVPLVTLTFEIYPSK